MQRNRNVAAILITPKYNVSQLMQRNVVVATLRKVICWLGRLMLFFIWMKTVHGCFRWNSAQLRHFNTQVVPQGSIIGPPLLFQLDYSWYLSMNRSRTSNNFNNGKKWIWNYERQNCKVNRSEIINPASSPNSSACWNPHPVILPSKFPHFQRFQIKINR